MISSFANCHDGTSSLANTLKVEESFNDIDPFGNLCNSNCPNGHKDVFLIVTPKEFYDGSVGGTMQRIEAEYRSTHEVFDKKMAVVVDSSESLRNAILHINSECYSIKKLRISSHGNNGYVSLGKMGIDVRNVDKLNGLSCAFSDNAEIYLDGCRIGRDTEGEDFIEEFGKRLLFLRGGSIEAANQYTSTFNAPFGTYLPRFSLDGRWKKFHFKRGEGTIENKGDTLNIDERIAIIGGRINEIKELQKRGLDKRTFLPSWAVSAYKQLTIAINILDEAKSKGGLDKLDNGTRLYLSQLIYAGTIQLERIKDAM